MFMDLIISALILYSICKSCSYPQATCNSTQLHVMPIFPIASEGNVIVLPDDAFRVCCVVRSQAAAAVCPSGGRGAKLPHQSAVEHRAAAQTAYLGGLNMTEQKTKTVNNNMRSHPAAIRPLWIHMLYIWTQCICWDHSWRGSNLPAAQSARTPRTDMRWGSGWAAQVPAGCAQLSFSATGVTWSHCGGHVTGSCSSASSNNKSTSYFLVLHKLGVSGNVNT